MLWMNLSTKETKFVFKEAGVLAGFDDEYVKAGATIAPDTSTVIGEEGIVLSINGLLQTDISSLTLNMWF